MDIEPGRPPGATALLEPVIEISAQITSQGLDASLLHLVRVQAAVLAGCAACRQRLAAGAAEAGLDARRLHGLSDWRGADVYSAKEQAVLAWSEAISRGAEVRAIEAAVDAVARLYSIEEQLLLGIALLAIHEAPCPHQPAREEKDGVIARPPSIVDGLPAKR